MSDRLSQVRNPGEPEPLEPSEPIRLESQGVFDQDYLREDAEPYLDDNPMIPLMKAAAAEYVKAIRAQPIAFDTPPKNVHKVRIFQLASDFNQPVLEGIAQEIEDLLNEGYCCHMPTVVNDFVIMDFARRKETKEK